MKILNNYKCLIAGFAAGLVLMGVGAGVGFFEFQSMTYCGEKNIALGEAAVKEVTAELPDTEKILYNQYGNIKIEPDESIDDNTAKAVFKAQSIGYVDFGFDEGSYIVNINTDHVSDKKYSFMHSDIYTDGTGDEFKIFKTFMYDIKERKIYDYKTPDSEIVIKVSPQNAERFQPMGDEYSFIGAELPFKAREGLDIYYNNEEYYTKTENGKKILYSPYNNNEYSY